MNYALVYPFSIALFIIMVCLFIVPIGAVVSEIIIIYNSV